MGIINVSLPAIKYIAYSYAVYKRQALTNVKLESLSAEQTVLAKCNRDLANIRRVPEATSTRETLTRGSYLLMAPAPPSGRFWFSVPKKTLAGVLLTQPRDSSDAFESVQSNDQRQRAMGASVS